jgi:fumarate reductase flavoprotein subunit
VLSVLERGAGERPALLRDEMTAAMEKGVGIYRDREGTAEACREIGRLRERYARGVRLDDHARAFNTEWLGALELGNMLEVAEAMAHSAAARRESRGAHMRLDHPARDDAAFLKHSLSYYGGDGSPRTDYLPVAITRSSPRARVYGGEGKQAVLT